MFCDILRIQLKGAISDFYGRLSPEMPSLSGFGTARIKEEMWLPSCGWIKIFFLSVSASRNNVIFPYLELLMQWCRVIKHFKFSDRLKELPPKRGPCRLVNKYFYVEQNLLLLDYIKIVAPSSIPQEKSPDISGKILRMKSSGPQILFWGEVVGIHCKDI